MLHPIFAFTKIVHCTLNEPVSSLIKENTYDHTPSRRLHSGWKERSAYGKAQQAAPTREFGFDLGPWIPARCRVDVLDRRPNVQYV